MCKQYSNPNFVSQVALILFYFLLPQWWCCFYFTIFIIVIEIIFVLKNVPICWIWTATCLFESHASQPSAPFPLASDILFVQVKYSTDVLVRMYFFSETPQSSSIHSLLPFPEFYLMDKDSSLRDIGGEETKGSKRSPRFKEDRRCVIGVEGKFPSPPTSPFLSSCLSCWFVVSLLHARLV